MSDVEKIMAYLSQKGKASNSAEEAIELINIALASDKYTDEEKNDLKDELLQIEALSNINMKSEKSKEKFNARVSSISSDIKSRLMDGIDFQKDLTTRIKVLKTRLGIYKDNLGQAYGNGTRRNYKAIDLTSTSFIKDIKTVCDNFKYCTVNSLEEYTSMINYINDAEDVIVAVTAKFNMDKKATILKNNIKNIDAFYENHKDLTNYFASLSVVENNNKNVEETKNDNAAKDEVKEDIPFVIKDVKTENDNLSENDIHDTIFNIFVDENIFDDDIIEETENLNENTKNDNVVNDNDIKNNEELNSENNKDDIFFVIDDNIDIPKEVKENVEDLENDNTSKEEDENRQNIYEIVPVSKVVTVKEQNDDEKKRTNKVLKTIAWSALALVTLMVLIAGLKGCKNKNKTNKGKDIKPNPTPTSSVVVNNDVDVESIDVNNEASLRKFAEDLKEQFDLEESIEEIMQATRLANLNILEDKKIFDDKQDFRDTMEDLGNIATVATSDNMVQKSKIEGNTISEYALNDTLNAHETKLTIADFKAAKQADGSYDVYDIIDICLDHILDEQDELASDYGVMLNETVCRCGIEFSEAYTCPGQTLYYMYATYDTNRDDIYQRSYRAVRGTGYGQNTENDGTYGELCIEELQKYMAINNDNNYVTNEKVEKNYTRK